MLHHLRASIPQTPLEELANVRIPGIGGAEILAFAARPSRVQGDQKLPLLVLIHEFYGLNPKIVQKAEALAEELGCFVLAPDTFRGVSTTFVPQAIWLALSTPQARVNSDLDSSVRWARQQPGVDGDRAAVMGFCYGGGKAIRFTTTRLPSAATVVCYGSPVTEATTLKGLKAPVCGVFGALDIQFPPPVLSAFREGLEEAGVPHDVQVYPGVGHAFWEDMDQVRRGDEPQTAAWQQITGFLRDFFAKGACQPQPDAVEAA